MTDIYSMTEAQLLQEVTLRCDRYGVAWVHIDTPHHNRRGQNMAGFPDLFLCGPEGAAFRELKSRSGRIGAEQWNWGHRLLTAGENWAVWQPDNLSSGDIDKELAALAGS